MSRGLAGAVLRGLGGVDHEATVVETETVTPHMVRVRLQSATLFTLAVTGPGAWVRIWFPDPDGGSAEHQRGYTFSECDPETGAFAIDFVLHEPAGPATLWAKQAQPGQTLPVTSYGCSPFQLPAERPAGVLLVGDSAAMPAINSILSSLPADLPVEVYLEQHDDHDLEIPLVEHPRARVHWVPRTTTSSLADAIEVRDWSDWYAWVTPEAATLKHFRTRLRDGFGFPKTALHFQAYWTEGKAMGKTRDEAAGDSMPAAQVPARVAKGSWRGASTGSLLAPVKPALIASGIAQAVVTLLQLAPYVLLVELSRRLLADEVGLRALAQWSVALLGAGATLEGLLLLWLHVVDARFARDLRMRLLGKLARLPLGWFTGRGGGSVKQVVQDDTLAIHYLVTHAVPDAVAAVIAPLAVLGYLIAVDWRLGLALLGPILVYVVTMAVMVMQSGGKTVEAQRWSERMTSTAAAYLEGQPVVRVFGGHTTSGFQARLDGYLAFLNEWQRPFTGKKTLIDLATRPGTFLLVIVGLGTLLVARGTDPVTLLPFLLLGTTFGARLLGVGYGLSGLQAGLIAARRVNDVLSEDELDQHFVPPKRDAKGRVRFESVHFAYRPGVPVLHGVSLVLEPGTVTALVGPSGSGKSTLAGLLARFHDVDTGAIRIGGDDVRALTPDALYSRVGFVLQDTALIQGTVRDNLALARPDATNEQVVAAAQAAHIHDRITQLPDGYETVLGPDPALSGGERQRLAIARALLADPAVLVLDEATAYADPESEFHVQQAISRLTRGRTVLVIAHRLHTISGVDRIVVLDGGRVAESGTHDELLAAGGRYRVLWDARGLVTA